VRYQFAFRLPLILELNLLKKIIHISYFKIKYPKSRNDTSNEDLLQMLESLMKTELRKFPKNLRLWSLEGSLKKWFAVSWQRFWHFTYFLNFWKTLGVWRTWRPSLFPRNRFFSCEKRSCTQIRDRYWGDRMARWLYGFLLSESLWCNTRHWEKLKNNVGLVGGTLVCTHPRTVTSERPWQGLLWQSWSQS
jgi:hypothetical protein